MSSATILAADTIAALDERAILLTGTNRLARELRKEYNKAKERSGESIWASPEITSLGNWLRSLWQNELCFHRQAGHEAVLLSRIQEDAVWERVIRDWCGREDRSLIQISAAAESAQSAYSLLNDWLLPTPSLDIHPNDDVRGFIAWISAFELWCSNNGRMSASKLAGKVSEAFRTGVLVSLPAVYLAGFEDETPAQQDLLDALRQAGKEIQRIEPPARDPKVRVATCPTPEIEIEACALWLRQRLENNPDQTIGVVVPDLSQQRTRILRVFEDVLAPASALPDAPSQQHVNLSLGPRLSEYPLISTALNALELLRGKIDFNRLGSLLRSPFLGEGVAEAQARALLDVKLRSLGERNVRLTWLIEQAGVRAEGRSRHAPRLESRLCLLLPISEDLPLRQGAAGWAKTFDNVLGALGWPGERTLNSSEHQVREKWKDLLDMFAGLETILDPLTLRQALARLRRLAARETFQPASDAAPVQVIGFLEAAGTQFDALWVMDLTDSQLPGLPHPHPLLPLNLQRENDLPHSSPNRELEFARRRLRGLVGAAPEVVLSYSRMEDDCENVPSPLLRPYEEEQFVFEEATQICFAQAILESAETEPFVDNTAPPLSSDQRASGGAGVLKSHAACPFQAFGQYRLHARQLKEPQDGLDSRAQGTLVHKVLERFWKELGDQEALLAMPNNDLSALQKRVVADAIDAAKAKLPSTFTPAFAALQRKMLEQLLDVWIEQDKKRSAFKVLDTEKSLLDQPIGDLTIKELVVDRIDELADGSCVVVDYKTGNGRSKGAWKGPRPDEPQLPLYATLTDGEVTGVAFANVKPDNSAWSGLTRDDGVIDGQKAYPSGFGKSEWEYLYPDWEALLDSWRHDLEVLANNYVAGDARVDPKIPNKTCTYCHLSAACRITELTERTGGWLIGMEDGDDDE